MKKPIGAKKSNKLDNGEKVEKFPVLPGGIIISEAAVSERIMRLSDLVKTGVEKGEKHSILVAVLAADAFATQVERAYELHLATLREITESLPEIAVRISPKTLSNKDELKKIRTWMRNAGVGNKSSQPTGRKVKTDTVWSKLAGQALDAILMAQASMKKTGNGHFDKMLEREQKKHQAILSEAEKLTPFSRATLPAWWQVAKLWVEDYWKHQPEELKKAESLAINTESWRRANQKEKPHSEALDKVYRAFQALCPK